MIALLLVLALDDPWFPLEEGSVWIYSGDWTVEVEGVENNLTILKSTQGGRSERRWISVTSDGVWVHRIDDRKLDRPALLLKLPLRTGDRWETLGLSYVVDESKVTATGTTAHGAIVIESWYERDRGLVKEIRTIGGVATTHELVKRTTRATCPSCKAKLVGGAKFCHECGATVGTKAAEIPTTFRIRVDEKKYEIRYSDFTFGWAGAQCEIHGVDSTAGGVVTHYISGMRAEVFADWRENSWKTSEGIRNVRRLKSETLANGGVRREIVLEYQAQDYHYLEVFLARGSRNIELVLWAPETVWEDFRDDFYGISDTFSCERRWTCPSCEAAVQPEDAKCACGATLVTPNEDLNRLARKWGIQIVVDPGKIYPRKTASGNAITAKAAPKKAIEEFCAILARELAAYPDEFFRQLELERMVLCRELRRDGAEFGGLSEYDTDTIHFEITQGKELKHYQTSKVHHEIFHFLDYRDDATIDKDDAWDKLNPSGFKYDSARSGWFGFEEKNPGFLNTYSMTAIGEDKAEIFGHLAVRAAEMETRAGKDKVIRRKIDRMKELVRSYCPQLDDAFWDRLDDGR